MTAAFRQKPVQKSIFGGLKIEKARLFLYPELQQINRITTVALSGDPVPESVILYFRKLERTFFDL